jgi:hypothetical protein
MPASAELNLGTSASPLTDALQTISNELAQLGYDIRSFVPKTLLRATVGGQTHNSVTGITAQSPDGHAVWTVRFDWDPEKQSHVNGSWRVHAAAQQRRGEESAKFFVAFRDPNTNGYYDGTTMLNLDAGNGDLEGLWVGWKTRYFEVKPVSGRNVPLVVVPEGTRR